jgi:hypothetical protein
VPAEFADVAKGLTNRLVFFVVNGYNGRYPATPAFLAAVALEGRRIAPTSPFCNAARVVDEFGPSLFLHNLRRD